MAEHNASMPSQTTDHKQSKYDPLPLNQLDQDSSSIKSCPPNYEWAEDDDEAAA